MVPLTGLEPVQVALADFKSAVSTYSTIAAYEIVSGMPPQNRYFPRYFRRYIPEITLVRMRKPVENQRLFQCATGHGSQDFKSAVSAIPPQRRITGQF